MFPPSAAARFEVPPGLTGLWQVSGRNRLTMLEGLELDIRYVASRSTWEDLKILAKTLPALLHTGAR
jgi:lipopolysaccharide/colanic/teichoic acid biosynthesis glycosyltransferase